MEKYKDNSIYQENHKKPIVEYEESVTRDWYEHGEKYFGRRVRDHGVLGTWSKTKNGYGFKIRLYCDYCSKEGISPWLASKKRWAVGFLSEGAPGLCYVHDYRGKFLADLRNQVFVCDDCEKKKSEK